MIQVQLLMCVETAIVDQRKNNLSLINVFEDMNVSGFPFILPSVCIVGVFTREQGDPASKDLEFDLKVGEQVLIRRPFKVGFTENNSTRTIIEVNGVAISKPARVVASLYDEVKVISSYGFSVQVLPEHLLSMFEGPSLVRMERGAEKGSEAPAAKMMPAKKVSRAK